MSFEVNISSVEARPYNEIIYLENDVLLSRFPHHLDIVKHKPLKQPILKDIVSQNFNN